MRDNVTANECCGRLVQIHICVKEKSDILSKSYDISIHQ